MTRTPSLITLFSPATTLLWVALPPPLMAAEAESVGTVSLDLATAYMFRGVTVTDTLVAQPALKSQVGPGLTLGAWVTWTSTRMVGATARGSCPRLI